MKNRLFDLILILSLFYNLCSAQSNHYKVNLWTTNSLNTTWHPGETKNIYWNNNYNYNSGNNYHLTLKRSSGTSYPDAIPQPNCDFSDCSQTWVVPDNLPIATDYYIELRGTIGPGTNWEETSIATSDLIAIGPEPTDEEVILSEPVNGAINISRNPKLIWHSITNADAYEIQISITSSFGTTEIDDEGNDTTYSGNNLEKGRLYYWRVRVKIASQYGPWSQIWVFKTVEDVPAVPVLESPPNGTVNVPIDQFVTWSGVSNATKYHLQVALDDEYSDLFLDVTDFAENSYEVRSLIDGKTYYWRVRAGNTGGYGGWSQTWTFSRATINLGIPSLIEPANNSSGNQTNLIFKWSSISGATKYDLRVATDNDFTVDNTVKRIDDITDNSYSVSNLNNNTTYYWRVRSKNNITTSNWSQTYQFSTINNNLAPTVTLTLPNSGTYIVGSQMNITWSSTNQNHYGLYLYKGNNQIATIRLTNHTNDYGDRSYSWTIPPTVTDGSTTYTLNGNDYKIKIAIWNSDDPNTAESIGDFSDNYITISPQQNNTPTVTLISPNSGSYTVGEQMDISWSSTNQNHYGLYLYKGNSQIATIKLTNHSNDNGDRSYSWTMPPTVTDGNVTYTLDGNDYRIKVAVWNSDDPNTALSTGDYSDNYLTISSQQNNPPTVTLMSPNSGSYTIGEQMLISWTSANQHHYGIYLYKDNSQIATIHHTDNNSTDRNYSWTIPSTVKDDNDAIHTLNGIDYKIKMAIWNSDMISIGDYSDGYLELSPVQIIGIKILTPNGGESWGIGSLQNIKWTSQNVSNIQLEYSINNGLSWNVIVSDIPAANNLYQWEIPNNQSKECLIKISDLSDIDNFDISDNVFSLIEISKNIYPQISISSGVLDLGQSVTISGSDFTINENVSITIFGNSIENETINISANSTGKWQTIYTPSVSGAYYISATDLTNSKTTTTKTLIVKDINKPLELELVNPLTKDYPDNVLKVGNTLALTWKDIANKGNKYPVSGTRREYKYLLEVSYDGGINWQEITLAGNWTDIGKQILEYRTFELTQESQNLYVRVIDYFDNSRVVESGPFKIGTKLNSYIKCGLVWDYSYPDRNGNPIGVAADGVARIYIKVFKVDPNTSTDIRNVSITLSDGKNNLPDLLGKVMPASITDEYSEEANNADQVDAVIEGNKNEYWFWYIAPDDFAHEVILNSSRAVYANIRVTFASGFLTEIKHELKIKRPPLILVHGLAGSAATWDNFKMHNGANLKYDSRFFTRAVNISPNAKFRFNAPILLPVEEGSGIFPNSIKEFRQDGFAANQVSYIGHSMGGNVLRAAVQEYPNLFKIGEGSRIKYKNYGQGFVDRAITLDTPHRGSPLADLLKELTDYINEDEVIKKSLFVLWANFSNLITWNLIEPNGENFITTGAIDDLSVNDGFNFTSTNVPSHMIAGDIYPGYQNIWDIPQDAWTILEASEKVLESFDKIINKALALAPEPIKSQLQKALKYSNTAQRVVTMLNILFKAYSSVDFIVDSDIIVALESQLCGQNSNSSNTKIFDGIFHTGESSSSVTSNKDVGEYVEQLLHTPINSNKFQPFPSTFGGLPKNAAKNKIFSKQVNSKTVNDINFVRIIEPLSNSTWFVDSSVTIKVSIADTANLQFVKVYFQNQVLYKQEKYNFYEFKTAINTNSLDKQLIEVLVFYDYGDSTKFYNDNCEINILPNTSPDNMVVSPIFTELEIDQFLYPEYNVEFENMVSRLGNNNEHIHVSIENPNTVEFNPVNGSFKGINEGETSVVITYKGVLDTIYIAVRESSGITGIDEQNIDNKYIIPTDFKIHQNYPNPFNPTTTIEYSIPKSGNVKIKIYDILGQEIKILVNEFKEPGNYTVFFDGSNLSSGIYFYKLQAGASISTRKMILLK